MESGGNAVVDFGRFCTGFLVVMGIGMSTCVFGNEDDRRLEYALSGGSTGGD